LIITYTSNSFYLEENLPHIEQNKSVRSTGRTGTTEKKKKVFATIYEERGKKKDIQ